MDQDHVTIVCLVVLWNLLYVMLVSKGSLTEVSNKLLTTSNELIHKWKSRNDYSPDPVDCEWTWSAWTDCDPGLCRDPKNTRDRYKLVVRAPQFGGTTCDFAVGRSLEISEFPAEDGRIQVQTCIPVLPCLQTGDVKNADKQTPNKLVCEKDKCKNDEYVRMTKWDTTKYRNGHITDGMHMLGWYLQESVLDNTVHFKNENIPHNVLEYSDIKHIKRDWLVQMFANTHELASNLSYDIGGSTILQPGYWNYTRGINKRTGEYYIVSKVFPWDYVQYKESKELILSESFKKALTNLSPVFSYSEYIGIFNKFGTHYHSRAPRGGVLAVMYGFDKCVLQGRVKLQNRIRRKDHLVGWVKSALEKGSIQFASHRKKEYMVGTFIVKASIRGGSLNTSQKMLSNFHKNVNNSVNALDEWMPTLQHYPHIIKLEGHNEIRPISELAESVHILLSPSQRATLRKHLSFAQEEMMAAFNRSLCQPCPRQGALLHISFDVDNYRKGKYGCFCEDKASDGGPCYLDSNEFKKISTYLAIFVTCLWLSYKWGIGLDVISRPINMSRDFLKHLSNVQILEWEEENSNNNSDSQSNLLDNNNEQTNDNKLININSKNT